MPRKVINCVFPCNLRLYDTQTNLRSQTMFLSEIKSAGITSFVEIICNYLPMVFFDSFGGKLGLSNQTDDSFPGFKDL